MANRCLLHISKLNEFALWMEKQGWLSIPTKGDFEILRLVKQGEKPVILYQRFGCDHASIPESLFPTVRRFILETRRAL